MWKKCLNLAARIKMGFGMLQIEEPVIPHETTVSYLQELKFQLCNLIKTLAWNEFLSGALWTPIVTTDNWKQMESKEKRAKLKCLIESHGLDKKSY